jgi:hypothetical protein
MFFFVCLCGKLLQFSVEGVFDGGVFDRDGEIGLLTFVVV